MKKIILPLLFLTLSASLALAQDTVVVYGIKNGAGKISKLLPGVNKDSLGGGSSIPPFPHDSTVFLRGDSSWSVAGGDYTANNNWFGEKSGNRTFDTSSAQFNTAAGILSMSSLTIGNNNNAFGAGALQNLTEGVYNTALGTDALYFLTTASSNTAVGQEAMSSDSLRGGFGENTAIGRNALDQLNGNDTSGYDNTALGFSAGHTNLQYVDGTVAFVGANFIGSQSGDWVPPTFSYATVIGSANMPSHDLYIDGYRADNRDGDASTIHGQAGNTLNKNGGSITLAGGISTGSGAGGDVIIKTSPAGGSGTSDNALVENFRFRNDGAFVVNGDAGTNGKILTSTGNGAPVWGNAVIDTAANYIWTGLHTWERSGKNISLHIVSDSSQIPKGVLFENTVPASNGTFTSNPPTLSWLSSLDDGVDGAWPVQWDMSFNNQNAMHYTTTFRLGANINNATMGALTLQALKPSDGGMAMTLSATNGGDQVYFNIGGTTGRLLQISPTFVSFANTAGGGTYILPNDTNTNAALLTLPITDGIITHWVSKPSTASSTGTTGDAAFESGFLYICVATNTWQRVAIATW